MTGTVFTVQPMTGNILNSRPRGNGVNSRPKIGSTHDRDWAQLTTTEPGPAHNRVGTPGNHRAVQGVCCCLSFLDEASVSSRRLALSIIDIKCLRHQVSIIKCPVSPSQQARKNHVLVIL